MLGQVTVPLYQGGAEYAAIRAARAREQQSFAAIIDQQRTAYAQATQAWEAFVASRDAIVSTNSEIKANAIALDGTEREEIVGTRTTLDVLNAQQALLTSQVQQVQNIAQLVENSYTVAQAIGRLSVTDLALPVTPYDDVNYYRLVKFAGIGTGEQADQYAGVAANGELLGSAPPVIVPPTLTAPPAPEAAAPVQVMQEPVPVQSEPDNSAPTTNPAPDSASQAAYAAPALPPPAQAPVESPPSVSPANEDLPSPLER